ncbi:hypothetical protein PACTADRAFT_49580 [Pachysolen tannophilus NRRL Y-2460]|uniref:Ketoreductase (KR) domain-containing protein n=1 Tax=Pachysolen tannophilus NRRL Y-2460 TaxID=669874 RepID=A0A1E4TWT1_PACTA|nr:hypothetical protein PACTADRAFT_49580 [Pachysolen tannophilus NRRL Y-2460]
MSTAGKIPLKHIVQINVEKAASLPEKCVGVFIGGTSGIGEHSAYAYAKYIKSPTIYLVGRNEIAATNIIEKLKTINNNKDAKYEFIKTDVSLIKEDNKLLKQILEKEEKVNTLVLTTGFLSFNGRTENSEGIDVKLGAHYYGRMRVIDGLIPLLKKSAERGEPSRAISVLEPGNERIEYPNDLDLKEPRHYSLRSAKDHACTMNSYAIERFARLYPDSTFVHMFPGFVATNAARDLPWYLKSATDLIAKSLGRNPADVGERVIYAGLTGEEFKPCGKGLLVSDDLKLLSPKIDLTEKEQERIWNHTLDVFKQASGKN